MSACEVCSVLGRGQKRGKKRLVGERLVSLCDSHALVLEKLPIAGVEELRRVFRERAGRRSLVERREAIDRRVFPARPEGRRRTTGRRVTDDLA